MTQRTLHRSRPTAWQVRRTRLVVQWYLEHHYGRLGDPGTRPMYYDRACVGELAVRPSDLREGRPSALFSVLVATAMFQRRQDVQIMRILRGLEPSTAREVGSLGRLLSLAVESRCDHLASNAALLLRCDLTKDPETGEGVCGERPELACHLKRHTVALKRYGHFGKVPTSIALNLRDSGARDLRALYRRALQTSSSPAEAALLLEGTLCQSWRVSRKIACMFLSVAANPDLGDRNAPWSAGLDWNHFVVIDTNVDLYLDAVGYDGPSSYDARRAFVQELARRVDLSAQEPRLSAYNARVVQQALYLFMSVTNRRAIERDCSHTGDEACAACPSALRAVCPRRAD